jgi:hypothetical protein
MIMTMNIPLNTESILGLGEGPTWTGPSEVGGDQETDSHHTSTRVDLVPGLAVSSHKLRVPAPSSVSFGFATMSYQKYQPIEIEMPAAAGASSQG